MTIQLGTGHIVKITDDYGVISDRFTDYLALPSYNRLDKLFRLSTNSAIYDFSTNVPGKFWLNPPSDELWIVYRINFHLHADSFYPANGFGDSGDELVNKIHIFTYDDEDNEIHDFTDGYGIEDNYDWGVLTGVDINATTGVGVGYNVQTIRWSLYKGGTPLPIFGNLGQKMVLDVRDDLSSYGIEEAIAFAQGIKATIISED